jgi:hypothetical protein
MSANLSIMKQLRITRDEQRSTIELLHRTVADLRERKAVLEKAICYHYVNQPASTYIDFDRDAAAVEHFILNNTDA